MRPGAHVVGSDVSLEIAGVGEDLTAVLAGVLPHLPVVQSSVSLQARLPAEGAGTQLTLVLVCWVSVVRDQVLVQSENKFIIICKV